MGAKEAAGAGGEAAEGAEEGAGVERADDGAGAEEGAGTQRRRAESSVAPGGGVGKGELAAGAEDREGGLVEEVGEARCGGEMALISLMSRGLTAELFTEATA